MSKLSVCAAPAGSLLRGAPWRTPRAHPHAWLGEVGPHGDLFARTHVGVAVSLKGRLQLLQLLAGEVRALPPLLFLQRAVFGGAAG